MESSAGSDNREFELVTIFMGIGIDYAKAPPSYLCYVALPGTVATDSKASPSVVAPFTGSAPSWVGSFGSFRFRPSPMEPGWRVLQENMAWIPEFSKKHVLTL